MSALVKETGSMVWRNDVQLLKYGEDVKKRAGHRCTCKHRINVLSTFASNDMCNPWTNVLCSYIVFSVKTCNPWISVLCHFSCRVVVEVSSILLRSLCKRSGCDAAGEI